MKRRYICFTVLIFLVLFISMLFGCSGGYRSISVATLSGSVSVGREGQSAKISAYEGMKLQNQDVVTVADSGSLVLKLDDDKYVYLESGTQIAINATGGTGSTHTDIELLKGSMSSVIENKLETNENFRVTVDNVSMVVRGTIFRITLGVNENGDATVTVQTVEGEVGIDAGGENQNTLGATLQDVILLNDTGGTFESVSTPIDYAELPLETLQWIREALQNKLDAATDPDEINMLKDIITTVDGDQTAEATPTPTPTSTPTVTPTPTPTEQPVYALTVQQPTHGTVEAEEGLYAAGTQISVTADPDSGYKFTGWLINGSLDSELGTMPTITYTMPASDTTISAQFKMIKYRLTIEQPTQGGIISGAAGKYATGAKIALTAVPASGYKFKSWLVDGSVSSAMGADASVTYTMPRANTTISAVFTPITYTLTIEQPAQNGTVSGASGKYAPGTEIALTATPSSGYRLTGWLVNGSVSSALGTGTSIIFTMPGADTTVSAEFALITYSLTYVQPEQGGGTISMVAGQYVPGETIYITVTPEQGYTFVALVINGIPDYSYSGSSGITFVMPDGDVTITAIFQY